MRDNCHIHGPRLRSWAVFASIVIAIPVSLAGVAAAQASEPIVLNETQRLGSGVYSEGSCFGASLDMEDQEIVIGGPCLKRGGGSVYAFARRTSGLWELAWYERRGWGYEDDYLGSDVSMDAGRVAVGRPGLGGGFQVFGIAPDGALVFQNKFVYPWDGMDVPPAFAYSLAFDGTTLVAHGGGYGGSAGELSVVEETGGSWEEVTRFDSPKRTSFDLDGDILLIGDPGSDVAAENAGAVRIRVRDASGEWEERDLLFAEDPIVGAELGMSVAIDGDRALAGARGVESEDTVEGVAYVFERIVGRGWRQVARLDDAGGTACERGQQVALAGDVAVVSCSDGMGSASVFTRTPAGKWTLRAHLVASDAEEGSGFGGAIAVDGSSVVVGADYQSNPYGGEPDGAAYVFDIGRLNDVMEVDIDVQPWRTPNWVDPRSPALVAVAILSSDDFDALQVNLGTLRLNPGDATARTYRVFDADRNRLPDLVVYVRVRNLRIGCGETEIVVTGTTYDGRSLSGSDLVTNRLCP